MDSSSFPRFISGPLSRLGLVSMLLVASALPIRAQMASTSASTLRVSPTVSHAHPGTPAGFEIDGNLVSSPGGQDWFSAGGIGVIDTLTCAGNPSQLPATFGHDNEWRTGIDGKFKTMSNKNDDDIGANAKPWHWESFGGNPQKNDITEIFAHSRTDGAGHGWIMMAAGTRAPMGDNHTDFEFNQAGLTITGDTGGLIVGNGPQGGRTVGDLLVSVDEINGGRNPVPTLRRWDGTQFVIIPESEWTGKFYAANNDTVAVAPCGAVNRKGDKVGAYDVDQFLEVAFRADLLLTPTAGACGNPATVMVKTRSSQSWTAELKDFALAGLGTPAAPECAISGPTTLCPRQSIQLCGPEGSNLTWSWSTGETSRCITVSSGGTYTLTVTGPGCPPTTCSTLVTEVTAPLCSVTGPDSLCAGKTAQLCGPEGSGLGYSWSTGAHTRCITIDAPGSYTLTVTNPVCETASCSITKVVNPASPTPCAISGPSTICAGTPAELCGPEGNGLSWKWSTGATTRCISVIAQGTYSLTVTGGACGPVTCEREILPGVAPVCTISGPEEVCPGQTVQLCGPEGFQASGFSYEWSTGAATRCINISSPGTYTLTVHTPDCGSATCTKTVDQGTTIACSISGPDDLDPGESGQLCGPMGTDFTYLWNTGETSRCISISQPNTYTLTVTSPTCGSATCSKVVRDRPTSSCRCSFFYPDDSNPPRSLQPYVGNILAAVEPGRDGCPMDQSKLKLWYNATTALGLGIRRVVVYTTPTDSTITDYTVSPSPASPACLTNPALGATAQTGNQTGNDIAVDGGRPIWPVLYVTDISFNEDSRAGDWEQGSTQGIPASEVCGVWTAGVRRVYLYNGTVSVQMDPSPAQNHWTLGAGSETPPGGFDAYPDQGYGAEVSWDLTSLGFLPGHRYRLYTIIHSARQAIANGGEAAHGCTRVVIPQALTLGDEVEARSQGAPGADVEQSLPTRFELTQNYPNPFSSQSHTAIRFALPERSTVRVSVYTIAGQHVATLAEGTFDAGRRVVQWDGTDGNGRTLAAGMYVCKLDASSVKTHRYVQVRKMLMTK